MLQPEAGLDALGWETDPEQAVRRIKEIQPSAVIIARQDGATDFGPDVARIQAECPGLQITEVDLETGVVRIYCGEEQVLQELKDLLSAVEGCGKGDKRLAPGWKGA